MKVPNLLFTVCIARSLVELHVRSFVLLRNFVAKLAAVAAASLLAVHAALVVINFILAVPE